MLPILTLSMVLSFVYPTKFPTFVNYNSYDYEEACDDNRLGGGDAYGGVCDI